MRPLLVGELNPHGADPRYALYPYPPACAGARLRVILGLSLLSYLRRFDRANLCTGRWSIAEARRRAGELWQAGHPAAILLGARVCAAWGVAFEPFSRTRRLDGGAALVILPHPSGRCRLWNEPGAADRARALLADILAGGLRQVGT